MAGYDRDVAWPLVPGVISLPFGVAVVLSQACLNLALVLNVLAAPADPVKLQWHFKEGDVFYLRNDMALEQTVSVAGRKVEQKMDQSTVTRYTVKKKNADKSVVLEQTILDARARGNLPGVEEGAKKTKGMTFTVTLDVRGEVTRFEGYKDFLDKLSDGDAQARAQLASMFPEEVFRQTISESFGFTPNRIVKVNDNWDRKYKISMGPIGDFAGTSTYKYVGKGKVDGKEFEKLGITASMKYAPPTQPGGLPFKIVKGTLKAEEFKGEAHFDATAGRLVNSSIRMKLKGELTISAQGREADMELEQNLRMKSQLSTKRLFLDD